MTTNDTHPPTEFKRRAAHRAGYTLVEVMMALAVLTVGASGIVAMQKFSLGGSLQARNLTAGVNVNAGWLERLNTEAVLWNDANNSDLAQMGTVNAFGALPGGANVVGNWVRLGATTLEGDDADLGAGGGPNPAAAYCTHLRLSWIGPPATSDTLRVELRTFWARTGRDITDECDPGVAVAGWTTAINDPAQTVAIGGIARRRDDYGWVFSTGTLRRHPL